MMNCCTTDHWKGKEVILERVHMYLPGKAIANIKKGWNDYYWNP
jgi:hypothetical protein